MTVIGRLYRHCPHKHYVSGTNGPECPLGNRLVHGQDVVGWKGMLVCSLANVVLTGILVGGLVA